MACEAESQSLDRLLGQVCRLHHARAHTLLEALGLYCGQPPLMWALVADPGLALADMGKGRGEPGTHLYLKENLGEIHPWQQAVHAGTQVDQTVRLIDVVQRAQGQGSRGMVWIDPDRGVRR